MAPTFNIESFEEAWLYDIALSSSYMDLHGYFRELARYNRLANERLYEQCAKLDDAEYRRRRAGSFGSIHALLYHILLGDHIWMELFEGGGARTPVLDTVVQHTFPRLREARVAQDQRIESFFESIDAPFFDRSFPYVNNRGIAYVETAPVAVGHMFNHQTHHRGQVHVMLSQTSVPPPALDLHRILNP